MDIFDLFEIEQNMFQAHEKVMSLVNLHYSDCDVEQVSMTTMYNNHFMIRQVMPKKASSAIATFEGMKKEHPEMTELLDKRIAAMKARLKMFEDPNLSKNEAKAKVEAVLDQVWSLSSFKVSRQLLTNDLDQVSSVSLLMTSSTALPNEWLLGLTRCPWLTQADSLSLTEITEEPG